MSYVTDEHLGEIINIFFICQMSGLVKDLNIEIYSDTINVINVTLHGGTTHQALPVHTTFNGHDHISESQQYQTF